VKLGRPPSHQAAKRLERGFLEMDVVIRGVQQILEWLLKKLPDGTYFLPYKVNTY
jgi:hypothetical protein